MSIPGGLKSLEAVRWCSAAQGVSGAVHGVPKAF